ncbi:MAG TPA: ComEC family competence protein, partial [Pirellulales bacterium]
MSAAVPASSRRIRLERRPRSGLAPSTAPLAPVACAFALGAACDRFAAPALQGELSLSVWLGAAFAALAAWLVAWNARWPFAAACLLFAWFALGGARHHQTWFVQRIDDVSACATRTPAPAMVEAVVLETLQPSAPRPPGSTRFKDDAGFARCDVAVERIRDRESWRNASGVARLNVQGPTPRLRAGDRVRIVGKLALPDPATNPGEFDYAARLRGQGITAVLSADGPECFTLLSDARRYDLSTALDDLRNAARQTLAARLSPDVAGMGQALILGGYDQVSREQIDRFVQTGSIHILAISGMHVAILAAALFFAVSRGLVPRRLGLAGIGLLTLAYCVLVGGETPVVRATVLVLIACAASWAWQRRATWNALFAAVLVALAWRPADLFAMGPQLSFLAAGMLIACDLRFARRAPEDPLDRLLLECRPWWQRAAREFGLRLGEAAGLSLIVYLATLPLVLWNYHIVSPAAVPLTVLLGVPSTFALAAGFGVLLFAGWFPWASSACGWLASGALHAMDAIVATAHELPASYFFSPAP